MAMTGTLQDADPTTLLNLDRYPVADLSSLAARRIILGGREQLAETGLCLLPDFVARSALEEMVGEARTLAAHSIFEEGRVVGDEDGPERAFLLPRPARNAKSAINYSMLGPRSAIRRLYEWDGLAALFREILGVPSLYRCADPVVSCVVAYYADGDELGWHFDPNDGVVTLLLQEADEGGEFQFAPRVRREGAEGRAVVRSILDGAREGVITAPIRAGTLSLFQGVASLHRVTRVSGPKPRIVLTMSFHETPGKQFSERIRSRYAGQAA